MIALTFAGQAVARGVEPSLSLDSAMKIQSMDPVYAIELYDKVLEQSVLDRERNIAAFNRGVLLMEAEDAAAGADSFRLAARYAATNAQMRCSTLGTHSMLVLI